MCRDDAAEMALEEEQIVSIISVGLASNILGAAWEAHEVAGPPDHMHFGTSFGWSGCSPCT